MVSSISRGGHSAVVSLVKTRNEVISDYLFRGAMQS